MGESPGTACGEDALGPAADDGLERDTLGAPLAEAPLDPPGELALRSPREPLVRQRGEDLVGQRARAAHRRDLVGVLDRAQLLDETGAGDRVDAGVGELAVERVRQMLLLELDPPALEELADRSEEAARGLHDLESVERTRAIRVPEVRVQRRAAVRLDENGRVRAREAR